MAQVSAQHTMRVRKKQSQKPHNLALIDDSKHAGSDIAAEKGAGSSHVPEACMHYLFGAIISRSNNHSHLENGFYFRKRNWTRNSKIWVLVLA